MAGESERSHENSHVIIKIMSRACPVVQEVAIYVDHKLDESYTPNKVSLRAGNSHHDFRVRVTRI